MIPNIFKNNKPRPNKLYVHKHGKKETFLVFIKKEMDTAVFLEINPWVIMCTKTIRYIPYNTSKALIRKGSIAAINDIPDNVYNFCVKQYEYELEHPTSSVDIIGD